MKLNFRRTFPLKESETLEPTIKLLSGYVHTIKLCWMNFASYRVKINKGFYAGVQSMTVRIIGVDYGNCGCAVS